MARSYGVDVAVYQSSNMSKYKSLGAKFSIVKVSEGTSYKNPLAAGQIASTKAHGMMPMGYFFATFSGNSTMAGYNADYAVSVAKSIGLPIGSYLAVDWEAGDGNVITGNSVYNTQAILVAMDKIKQAGFKPLFYSGASSMKNNVNTKTIVNKYPNSLWVAQYPISGAVNQPDFNYFPSLDGVLIWQFTDNWCGAGVDGNVAVLDLNGVTTESVDDEMSWHPEVKYNELGRFKVNQTNGCNLYSDYKLSKVIAEKKQGTYKIFRAKNGAVEAGKNQWFSQADGLTKINPLATNTNAHAICKVIVDEVFTQNELKASAGVMSAPKGKEYRVFGRIGKYLIVGNTEKGKYLDGDKCNIML